MENKLPEGQFQITDGPSKFDLMCSLFDGKKVKITCNTFVSEKMKICPKLDVVFSSIGVEDGSHDSWIGEVIFLTYSGERRKFYYDTRRRTGCITAK